MGEERIRLGWLLKTGYGKAEVEAPSYVYEVMQGHFLTDSS